MLTLISPISCLFKSCPQNYHLKIHLLISQIRAEYLESITLGGNKIINNSTQFKKWGSSLTFHIWSPTAHSSLFSSASNLLSCNPFSFHALPRQLSTSTAPSLPPFNLQQAQSNISIILTPHSAGSNVGHKRRRPECY